VKTISLQNDPPHCFFKSLKVKSTQTLFLVSLVKVQFKKILHSPV